MQALFTVQATKHAAAICAAGFVVLASVSATAQTASNQATPVQKQHPVNATLESRPTWDALTPAQQAALKPMQADWAQLDAARKKKWLAVAQRYHTMNPADQARMHARLSDWNKLTPEQRKQARDNYSAVLSSPSSKPEAGSEKANINTQYEKYLALSPEKRAELRAKAEQIEAAKSQTVKIKPL